jgi:hypothetical protein
MTAVLERVPVDRITAEAKDVRFWRTVLTAVAGLLYGIGWLAAKTVTVLWRSVVWIGVAVKVGWQDARKPEATVSD